MIGRGAGGRAQAGGRTPGDARATKDRKQPRLVGGGLGQEILGQVSVGRGGDEQEGGGKGGSAQLVPGAREGARGRRG